jgi:hypothetical protein
VRTEYENEDEDEDEDDWGTSGIEEKGAAEIKSRSYS